MSRPVVITCAVTGGAPVNPKNRVPVTPKEIAVSAIEAWRAGAAIVHIHVRDPETGGQSGEFRHYEDVVNRIKRSGSDVAINLTTGFGGRYLPNSEDRRLVGEGSNVLSPEERCRHVVELRPELCSLDMGSMNFGEIIFANTPGHIRTIAEMVRTAGVKPELEIFEVGQLRLAAHLLRQGAIDAPAYFQLCLGIAWGSPADTRAMQYLVDQLPDGANWAGFGVGEGQFAMAAQAVILGGHMRVGLEDNLYIARGVPAPSNAALVARAVAVAEALGATVASPETARRTLGLRS
jgi:uncharacterized protein (DUF849 family)